MVIVWTNSKHATYNAPAMRQVIMKLYSWDVPGALCEDLSLSSR
jgi:hypothetical protein